MINLGIFTKRSLWALNCRNFLNPTTFFRVSFLTSQARVTSVSSSFCRNFWNDSAKWPWKLSHFSDNIFDFFPKFSKILAVYFCFPWFCLSTNLEVLEAPVSTNALLFGAQSYREKQKSRVFFIVRQTMIMSAIYSGFVGYLNFKTLVKGTK